MTGGAKRVGKAICEHLASEGYSVLVHYRNSRYEAVATRDACIALGASVAEVIHCDLSDPQQRSTLIARAVDSVGCVDLLVNSASMFEYDTADSFGACVWDAHLQSNYIAPVELTMELYRWRATFGGTDKAHVVTVLDQKILNLNTDYMSYTLSKLASQSSIRYLAQCCATHLRVNAVAPGVTMISGDMNEQDFKQAHGIAALGSSNTPEDIARTIVMLDQLQAVTGQTIAVDGGQHLVPRARDVAFKDK